MTTSNPFEIATSALAQSSPFVELYTLDTTPLGTPTLYNWTNGPLNGAPVVFAGITYQSAPIKAEGFDYSGQGPLPTPTLSIDNVNGYILGLMAANNDLLGCTVYRVRTYAQFLGGNGTTPNDHMFAMPEIFSVERKAYAAEDMVKVELSSALDLQGRKIPFRLVLQGQCIRPYRIWNGSSFVSANLPDGTPDPTACPYTGSLMWTNVDQVTTDPTKDVCSRKLLGCNNRFNPPPPSAPGPIVALPTYAFPGASTQRYG